MIPTPYDTNTIWYQHHMIPTQYDTNTIWYQQVHAKRRNVPVQDCQWGHSARRWSGTGRVSCRREQHHHFLQGMTRAGRQMTPQNRCTAPPHPGWPPTAEKCLRVGGKGNKHWSAIHVPVWGNVTPRSWRVNLTILRDGAQHPLQNVIVDNDVQETKAVEVAIEGQGEDGWQHKHLGQEWWCVLYSLQSLQSTCTYPYHDIHCLQPENVHIRVCFVRWCVPTE